MPESITARTQVIPEEVTAYHLYMLLLEVKRDIDALRTFATTHTHSTNGAVSSTQLGSQNLLG